MRNNYLPLVSQLVLQTKTPFYKVSFETLHKELAVYVHSCPKCCLFMQKNTWVRSVFPQFSLTN